MSKILEICTKEQCTACEACRSACPANAITMTPNEKGFLFPVIDESKCIRCNLCVKLCPENYVSTDQEYHTNKNVFAAWIKDKKIRKESSSGGIFSAIADYILSNEGVVFGACWADDLSVVFDCCTVREGLRKFRGSKYVQARIGDNYKKAKEYLDNGRDVLFSGTPCQIAGLKSYLTRNYSNLITLDLICHGVPSPMVFKDYIQYMEKQHQDKIESVFFRKKKPAWSSCSICLKFKHTIYMKNVQVDPYFMGFAGNFYLRECCLQCKYANLNRMGDITIGDFWGYRASSWKMRDFDMGCSSIILNTQKGAEVFGYISRNLLFEKRTIEEVINGNSSLIRPYLKAENSDKFWEEYLATKNFQAVSQKYLIPTQAGIGNTFVRWTNRYIFLIPKPIFNWLKIIKYKILPKINNQKH